MKPYPKRNAPLKDPKPKYEGKSLWKMGDTKVKCRDCHCYASHQAIVRREPNPFDPTTKITVPFCDKHARKSVATGECMAIKAYAEYRSYKRALELWESRRATDLDMQGTLV